MNDERISQALQQLRSAVVTPPLVSDSELRAVTSKRHLAVALYAVIGCASVVGLLCLLPWWSNSLESPATVSLIDTSAMAAPEIVSETLIATRSVTIQSGAIPQPEEVIENLVDSTKSLIVTDGGSLEATTRPLSATADANGNLVDSTKSLITIDGGSLEATTRPLVTTPARLVALYKQPILTGHPFVVLPDASLERFGITKDAVTICEGQSCITLDSTRSTFVNPTYRRPQIGLSGSMSEYTDGIMLRKQSTTIVAKKAPIPIHADAGSYLEVQVSGKRDTLIKSFSLHRIRMLGGSVKQRDWLDQYPLAKAFAFDVASELMSERIPIDSLGYYWVRHGNTSIPVLKLLFGLRTSTEWTTSPDWNGDLRRLAHIAWYLPSQRVMNALPESVRLFLQPEYEALYASIERDQSIRDVCTLLANPSALGFCSLADTTLRIDGIGPIPARDHFTMFITSDEATNATIDLIDASGTVVFERSNVAIQAGSTGVPVPLDRQLQQGAYMVILTTPTSVRRSRLLIGE